MRISDLRKNGCFRGYSLPKFTLDSSSIYEPLKPFVTSRCESDPVFYVHQGHLPTHMRSLRLSRHADLQVDRHGSSHTCRVLLTAAVVALFLVSLLCFFLSMHVWNNGEDFSATPHPDLNETSSESRTIAENKIDTIFFKSNISRESKDSLGYTIRQSCVADTCRTYSAFRFKASCYRGYCQCNGKDYQRETCLPKYGDCYIQKKKESFADAYIKGRRPAIYSCQPNPSGVTEKLHVISSFGNSQSNETTVEIFGDSMNSTPATIVLSNYHRVKWRVVLKDTHVVKIFLISHHHLRWSSVTVETADTSDPHPPVEKLFSQVGYGEDRYGGHTVDLLKTVNQRIGHMSSFTGVASADRWRIYLNKQ